ncbi:hypothetical protein FQR65_LT21011 [Abscondita terminalis]|nr:hypothetical protein FQR65_LT21011 [Abscondita terminalis]
MGTATASSRPRSTWAGYGDPKRAFATSNPSPRSRASSSSRPPQWQGEPEGPLLARNGKQIRGRPVLTPEGEFTLNEKGEVVNQEGPDEGREGDHGWDSRDSSTCPRAGSSMGAAPNAGIEQAGCLAHFMAEFDNGQLNGQKKGRRARDPAIKKSAAANSRAAIGSATGFDFRCRSTWTSSGAATWAERTDDIVRPSERCGRPHTPSLRERYRSAYTASNRPPGTAMSLRGALGIWSERSVTALAADWSLPTDWRARHCGWRTRPGSGWTRPPSKYLIEGWSRLPAAALAAS